MKNLLYIAILTTCIVLAWVGLSVYHNFTTSTISPITNTQIKQIPPSFDNATVELLGKRKPIPVDLKDHIMTPLVTPTPIGPQNPSPSGTITNQEVIEATPAASITPIIPTP